MISLFLSFTHIYSFIFIYIRSYLSSFSPYSPPFSSFLPRFSFFTFRPVFCSLSFSFFFFLIPLTFPSYSHVYRTTHIHIHTHNKNAIIVVDCARTWKRSCFGITVFQEYNTAYTCVHVCCVYPVCVCACVYCVCTCVYARTNATFPRAIPRSSNSHGFFLSR